MAKGSAIAAALLVAGAGGAAGYYYWQTNRSGGDRPEQLAQAVPATAYAVGYVATDPQVWGKLGNFGNAEAQQLVGRSLQQVQKEILSSENLDYQKDIQPWLGNLMFALDSSGDSAQKPAILAVSKVKDQIGAYNFLNKIKGKTSATSESEYKGAKVWTTGTGDDTSHAAYFNNWLVVSNHKKTLEKSIDAIQGGDSFKRKNGDSFFANDSLALPNQVAAIHIDFPRLVTATAGQGQVTQKQLQQLDDLKSITGNIGIDTQGIRTKALTQMNGASVSLPNSPNRALQNFPPDTVMVTSGVNLKDIWTETAKQLAADPDTKGTLSTWQASFRDSTGLDLEKDVFSWLGGEYALGLVTKKDGFWGGFGMGLVAIFDSTDRAATDRALGGVKSLASSASGVSERKSNDGKSINDINNPLDASAPLLSYGWLNDKSVFFATGEVSTQAPLLESSEFKEITGSLPQSNSGYFYVNFDRLVATFDSKWLKPRTAAIPGEALSLLKSVKGLGAVGRQEGQNFRSEGLLVLKPKS
jgi:hypothetical protein